MSDPVYGCRDVDELDAAFALGAVEPEERSEIVAHLEACGEPHANLRALLGAGPMLAASLEPVQPSSQLRSRLMASVAATPQEHRPTVSVTPAAPSTASVEAPRAGGWLAWLSPGWARGLAAGGLAATLVLTVVSVGLWTGLTDRDAALRAAADAIAGAQATHQVAGSHGSGWVVQTDDGAVLIANVAELPADQLYEMWLVDADGATVAAGTFVPGAGSELAVVPVDGELAGFTAFAITVEDEPVEQSANEAVLVGSLES